MKIHGNNYLSLRLRVSEGSFPVCADKCVVHDHECQEHIAAVSDPSISGLGRFHCGMSAACIGVSQFLRNTPGNLQCVTINKLCS